MVKRYRMHSRTAVLALLFAFGLLLGSSGLARAAGDPHRGGKLRILALTAGGTIDPQINYTEQFWQVYQPVYDGLVTYKKAGGTEAFTVVPDLAEALPPATDGGKTYTFKLRRGIQFSNGQPVTLKDVLASFQRIFKVLGPTAGSFYNLIVGADVCIKTPATCTLAGGVVLDEKANTVTIHLTQPDSEFLDKLAVPHAVILPADTPAKDAGVQPIPGTGPYMIVDYDPKKQLRLVRNPHFKLWSADAQPDAYPDEIDYEFGLPVEDAVTAIANDQADWTFDPIPADRLNEVGTKYAKQAVVVPRYAIFYLPMNMRLAPFDNLKARQAVNFALDRKSLVKIYGGSNLGSPSCQILPPGLPGYEPYCPYTKNPGKTWSAPDLEKAKQLVKESGTAGQKVTLVTDDTPEGKGIGTYVQSVLSEIGYDASVKSISANIEFTYIQNTNNKVQISFSRWYQDYPAASDFLNVLFSCASFREGSDASINISGLCDKSLDAEIARAQLESITNPSGANAMWGAIDRRITDLAAVAVLFNPKRVSFFSKRIQNIQISGQFQWLFAQSWVQ
jgi:peptide/nickel transport system substrate-binding protein